MFLSEVLHIQYTLLNVVSYRITAKLLHLRKAEIIQMTRYYSTAVMTFESCETVNYNKR